jgi:hypothetical protein
MVSGGYFLAVCDAWCRKFTPDRAVISTNFPGGPDDDADRVEAGSWPAMKISGTENS